MLTLISAFSQSSKSRLISGRFQVVQTPRFVNAITQEQGNVGNFQIHNTGALTKNQNSKLSAMAPL